MFAHHLLRVGLFGQVGRFASADGVLYSRRSKVICRTSRGTELGEVLTADSGAYAGLDGTILRKVTVEDQLLLARLEKHRNQAFQACQRLLRQRDLSAVLMDVEHLFDGRGLYFYFLGEISPELDALTAELADVYDSEVQFRRFAQTLTEGCGPGCGTEQASGQGCGTSGCGSCAVAGACGTRRGG
jgi:cell fate regulator YaaT (PSP1 superfamily)